MGTESNGPILKETLTNGSFEVKKCASVPFYLLVQSSPLLEPEIIQTMMRPDKDEVLKWHFIWFYKRV